MIKYMVVVLLTCLNLTACSDDLRYVVIQYEGYKLPKGVSLWLENGPGNKLKIMDGEKYYWTGYFRPGDVFTITSVKNDERVRSLQTVFINNLDNRTITCDKDLNSCEEK